MEVKMSCETCKYRNVNPEVCKVCKQDEMELEREKMVHPYMRKSYREYPKVQLVSMR